MPEQRRGPAKRPPAGTPPPGNEPTTAFQAQPADPQTEKLDTRDDERKRRGGGVSAADLLRREGRA